LLNGMDTFRWITRKSLSSLSGRSPAKKGELFDWKLTARVLLSFLPGETTTNDVITHTTIF